MKERHTITPDEEIVKRIRKMQADSIGKSCKPVSFSFVIEQILRKAFEVVS